MPFLDPDPDSESEDPLTQLNLCLNPDPKHYWSCNLKVNGLKFCWQIFTSVPRFYCRKLVGCFSLRRVFCHFVPKSRKSIRPVLHTKLFVVRNGAKICKVNPRVLHREEKSAKKYSWNLLVTTAQKSVAFIYLRLYCWKSAPPPTGAGYNFLPAIHTHFIHAWFNLYQDQKCYLYVLGKNWGKHT